MKAGEISNQAITDVDWGTASTGVQGPLPEWAQFLISLGSWAGGVRDISGRLFCTVLLPSRTCASALIALGALCNSLQNPSDEISWETFLDCENGIPVYFLHDVPEKGKRQMEGILGETNNFDGQQLRQVRIKSKRKDLQGLTIFISEAAFSSANVALHPHHRTTLLNALNDLSSQFQGLVSPFNENRLLLSHAECMIVTNRAVWEREVDGLVLSRSSNTITPSTLTELLMLKYGRVKLFSPRSRDIGSEVTDLSILDGIDSLRSRDSVLAQKTVVLLDQSEYQEEAEDIIRSFSDCCDTEVPTAISNQKLLCPSGIELQLYYFQGNI